MGEHGQDGRLIRRVRWQLIGWSAGSMLVVLAILGAVIYAAVASALANASENLLRDRAGLLRSGASSVTTAGPAFIAGEGTLQVVTSAGAGLPGFAIEGPYAGTLGIILPVGEGPLPVTSGAIGGVPTLTGPGPGSGSGVIVTGGTMGPTEPLLSAPDPAAIAAAAAGQTTIRETTSNGSPVRVLTAPGPDGATVISVLTDRSAEVAALRVLALVLVVGGLLAVLAAALAGRLYAMRALVPIRASLQRQREFAADTSHELRTPLAVIRASIARVRQQPDATVATVARTLDTADAEAVRLAALVDDLLALARTDAGPADLDLAPFDLSDVAAEALAALEPVAAARSVTLSLDVEPAPMVGDAARIRRLVTVLGDNAVRHGREGGNARVRVRRGTLQVDDDGPGIPATDRPHVFDRFWRGEGAAAGGSGLGLAIAAWIAERHGGSIAAGASDLGGARFTVLLPNSPPGA